MLDIDARLTRQAIGIAVDKALEDVKGNTRRSIRNLIDLGLLFSQTENQKWFFGTAKQVIENPKNPYKALVSRAVRDIHGETIRRVGLNLGYNSLTYGAKRLRKRQETLDVRLPWMLEVGDVSGAEFSPNLASCLQQGQDLGIYSYVFQVRSHEALAAAVELAVKFEDCFFAFRLSGDMIDDEATELIAQAHNVAVSVDIDAPDTRAEGAFRRLRENRCLYGYFLTYQDRDISRVTSPQFVKWGIGVGCLFGAYQAAADATGRARDRTYEFVCKLRGESGQPLIALDWPRDLRETGEKMRIGGLMAIDLAEKAFAGRREAINPAGLLADILRRVQVCPT